ncbi:hypothetical protein T8J41_14515 [Nitratireductor rhodophyticola]|uniref:DUF7507 domain-containing protein n=2 Tax=Nitratireductor rhodophyticola TaxID=2854036 RepID=UPI002AC96EAB|nr:hypothetical protein [Nitratireductor rhodophyticola]WPZ13361.1 hypothetical protein T8J41_14515 [Nitratireductor rhodophyticola]
MLRGKALATILPFMLSFLPVFGLLVFACGPVNAQTIPPTSPCTYGFNRTPPGWTVGSGTPDCSDRTTNPLTNAPWNNGPIPVTPDGYSTFTSFHDETISTTMTDLEVGREYRVPMFAAPWSTGNYGACRGLRVSTTGVTTDLEYPAETSWNQQAFVFTAQSTTQPLTIGSYVTPGSACMTAFVLGSEVVEIIKTVSGGDVAGDLLTFTMTVENQGIGSLSSVSISDDILERADGTPLTPDSGPTFISASAGSPEGTLAEGETATYTLAYTLTQDDIDAGGLSNQATAEGTDENGNLFNDISSDTASVDENPTTVAIPPNPDFDFIKQGELEDLNGNGYADAGEPINYSFTIVNTGNVTLTDIVVQDDKTPVSGSPIVSLIPDEGSSDLTGAYAVTQQDIDRGFVENLATATAKDPQDNDVERQSRALEGVPGNPTVVSFEANPAIEVDLIDEWIDTNGNGYPDVGESITYSFVVRNTGNVTLDNIMIASLEVTANSSQTSIPVALPVASLSGFSPGSEDTTTFSTSYTLTQADIDAGGMIATARVDAIAPNNTPVSDISDDPDETADVDVDNDEDPDDPTPTLLPHNGSLALEKTGEFRGTEGQVAEPGDTIVYTFNVTNDGNVTVTNVVPVDAGPRFDGRPGRNALSSFSPPSAELLPGQSATFTATYTVTKDDIDGAQGIESGVKNVATASGKTPSGQDVISPEGEAVLDLPGFAISKMTPMAEVRRGGRVPYTIRVGSLGFSSASTLNIVDMTPPGLTFVRGSALVDGGAVAPKVDGRKLTFENIALPAGGEVLIDLELVVTSAAKPGEYINRAWGEDVSGEIVSRIATATVEVVVEAVFDCGDILGKVFDDKNRNGYQDAGEPGLPGVRVATVKGLLLTADDNGRFHVACADLPDQRIGTNYIMKLDPRSLPSGYRLTTENPRVVRLTAGKASEFQFGASIGRVVRLDLTDAAFVQGAQQLRPEWETQIAQMIALLDKEPSVLRLVYAEGGEGKRLAKKRINALRKLIAREWRGVGRRYRLEIEARVLTKTAFRSTGVRAFQYK